MPNGHLPLLLFPQPEPAERSKMARGGGALRIPGIERQRARLAPQFATLLQALDNRRLRLEQFAPVQNPELVLILEVVGDVGNFAKAVARVPALDWLVEWARDQVAPDEDFRNETSPEKTLADRLFLLGTNEEALTQLLALWDRYQRDPEVKFEKGLAPFKHVFSHLRTIRPWDVTDRIDRHMRAYWQDRVDSEEERILFEIDAWHYPSPARNTVVALEVQRLVAGLGGRVLGQSLIDDIRYHGFLAELPAAGVETILAGDTPLIHSDRIMYFRPRAQAIRDANDTAPAAPGVVRPAQEGLGPPVVALLDGLPLPNHPLLEGRLVVDDPDGWETTYEAKDRMHGTAMASLILHGELDAREGALQRAVYVRPILRPDPADFNQRRSEQTPNDTLLIDLIHRAVKRIFEGEAGEPPVAPSVRVINLSVGDVHREFVREMSPWARLLDWLSNRYRVLFVVSAGNYIGPVALQAPRGTLASLSPQQRTALAVAGFTRDASERRLLSPAESINAVTVGALSADTSTPMIAGTRFDLGVTDGVSPISRVGLGYKRAIKPDVVMPGGRILYTERMTGPPNPTVLDCVRSAAAPGHRVAIAPLPGGPLDSTGYTRGTSNSAALASRTAARIYDALDEIRTGGTQIGPPEFDAVLIKALLVHGASWGSLPNPLLAELSSRPTHAAIADGRRRHAAEKDFVSRWIGYGAVDADRSVHCTQERATLIGVGELSDGEANVFSCPLPPSLARVRAWRRLTLTLAWLSPINAAHLAYRCARLWVSPPRAELGVVRTNGVHDKAALRGTVQHECLEGEQAVAFVDGDRLSFKVNCAADAGGLSVQVQFALCVSLEVAVGAGIPVYDEVRARIAAPVRVGAART
jgi:hypothetical protein